VTAPEKIGKKATTAARATMARPAWSRPAQISTSGAIATTGVTCSTTASGLTARSRIGLRPTRRAVACASTLATRRAISAMDSVFHAECSSPAQSLASALATAEGGGRK
jgi:hypothetical protein